MPSIVVIYFFLMFIALIVILTALSVKKHGFSWPPAAIGGVIALTMVLQRVKTGGSFNLVYLVGVLSSMCIIYLVIGFVMRKVINK